MHWVFAIVLTVASQVPIASVEEMIASPRDLWGEAALQAPGGPSYEFFRDLLPPVRYANTAFRHYPIMLSAPRAAVKTRWISDGSGVNLRANKPPMWRDWGVPVQFLVGRDGDAEPFGAEFERLNSLRYAEGWLPIVQIAYRHQNVSYEQEAFAAVQSSWKDRGAVLVRFTTRDGSGRIAARLGPDSEPNGSRLIFESGVVRDAQERAIVAVGPGWSWVESDRELRAEPAPGRFADLIVFSKLEPAAPGLTPVDYDAQRASAVAVWSDVLKSGMTLSVPEPIVQDVWRALIVNQFAIAVGDRMHYSAGNAYDHLYEAECGDAVRSLLLYGHQATALRMVGPLLDFQRKATRFHVAGQKLQLLAHSYWATRDADFVAEKEASWRGVVDFIIKSREGAENGLLPKDNYAGDINQQVHSLNSNANCWRGLRDWSAVLRDLGRIAEADRLSAEASSFRLAILRAVAQSERKDVKPAFIPNALFGVEGPHHPLTATRMGSYYDLMVPYILGSGVFDPGSDRETVIIDYLRQHGGLAMGMIRSQPHQGEFNKQPGVNVLYGLRYMLTLLRRDDRDHALVGFYGQMAQAMTRGAYVGAEGTRFVHGDRFGRSMYLPPNSAANAMFLLTLRYLLIQDWDMDNDGTPETLRLLHGIPERWLADGETLEFRNAPSMFGLIGLRARSRLAEGEIQIELETPPRSPRSMTMRPPLPAGWLLESATCAGQPLPTTGAGVIDLTKLPPSRRSAIIVRVRKSSINPPTRSR